MLLRPVFVVLLLTTFSSWSSIGIKVSDSRANNYYMDALIWILDKSGADYHLVHTGHSMSSQARKVALVQRGELDVMYAGTTNEMEASLMPIRFPITRGLIGSRIFIINKRYVSDYERINNVSDLKKYSGVLGFGWADKEILEAEGLMQAEKVYDDIFVSINLGSRYYFPRGILEAYSELIDKEERLPNLKVEEKILLRYKAAVFFFINPNNQALADVLNQGFKKGYEDGSYEEFLYNHPLIKRSFDKANLGDRLAIDIPNPFFPKASNDIANEYWHQE